MAVLSLSTPNVFFAEGAAQAAVARMVNDAYAELIAAHPEHFKGFASIPMDDPDAAVREVHRAIDELKLNGVILLSNIRGRALDDAAYRPFFEEADRMKLCVLLHPMLPASADAFRDFVLGPLVGFPFDTTLAVARMCFSAVGVTIAVVAWLGMPAIVRYGHAPIHLHLCVLLMLLSILCFLRARASSGWWTATPGRSPGTWAAGPPRGSSRA